MKSIILQEPGEISLANKQDPINPENDDVLIAIKRIGICGTDIHAFKGNQPFFTYPRILGHEISGVVEVVGERVGDITIGDTVAVIPYMHCGNCDACRRGKTNCCTDMQVLGVHNDGGMGDYVTIPSSHVIPVNELTLDEAAIVEPLSIGAHAIRRAQIQKGETVLVIGAGPIGLGVARFTKLQGAKTIVMDLNEERLNFCQEWAQCDVAINGSDNALQQLLDIGNGSLPSVVFDATGNKHSMVESFNYVGHGGKLVFVGLVKDPISFSDPDFHSKEMTLIGSRNATKEDFYYVINCLSKGMIKPSYITNKIQFDDTVSYFKEGNFQTNKAVIMLD
ncbi:zinc-binding alcohol dehydrogenase family protein [Aquibacillus sp. 3ASR75-11]|uniref:Zinc-binding alcohol dehydrogenase family protein n=1 Tax=Terrihalobacillus insolitus TaxID=2950438 RepID=A0A9X3WU85_9BACI|nr:zinc-binding alcohol dehydrogenase family protein [Terrihalobacillus insolitus]MDC3423409.1 zinc-binding alcohol dehydrogenase family protein [Terrihalobacillus insolitus]